MNVCVQLLLYRVVRSYTGSQVPVGVHTCTTGTVRVYPSPCPFLKSIFL